MADITINYTSRGFQAVNSQLSSIQNQIAQVQITGEQGFAQVAAGVLAAELATKALTVALNAGSKAYELFIGQNERFLTGTNKAVAGLVSNLRVLREGKEIEEISEQFDALIPKVEDARREFRQLLNEVAGETAAQANVVFETLVTNSAQLVGQSKEFSDVFEALPVLAQNFTSALVASGVPLVQARQEILAILQGRIDNNAALALFLNLQKTEIEQFKEQGILVDALLERFEGLNEAGQRNAKTIEALTGTLVDQFEQVAQAVGAPIYEEFVNILAEITSLVERNRDTIEEFTRGVFTRLSLGVANILDAIRFALNALQLLTPISGDLERLTGGIEQNLKNAADSARRLAGNIITGTTEAQKQRKAIEGVTVAAKEQGEVQATEAEKRKQEREEARVAQEAERAAQEAERQLLIEINALYENHIDPIERIVALDESRIASLNSQERLLKAQQQLILESASININELTLRETAINNEESSLRRLLEIEQQLNELRSQGGIGSEEEFALLRERQGLFRLIGQQLTDQQAIEEAITNGERERLELQRQRAQETAQLQLQEIDNAEALLQFELERLQIQEQIEMRRREITELEAEAAVETARTPLEQEAAQRELELVREINQLSASAAGLEITAQAQLAGNRLILNDQRRRQIAQQAGLTDTAFQQQFIERGFSPSGVGEFERRSFETFAAGGGNPGRVIRNPLAQELSNSIDATPLNSGSGRSPELTQLERIGNTLEDINRSAREIRPGQLADTSTAQPSIADQIIGAFSQAI